MLWTVVIANIGAAGLGLIAGQVACHGRLQISIH
jgi:hypothetical protein